MASANSNYDAAFPASRKVYVEGRAGIRVPMRKITLSGGKPPLQVYDTIGPLSCNVRDDLPPLRATWLQGRGNVTAVQRLPANCVRRDISSIGV